MKIFPQFDKNDCGLSVLQSLVYERFKVVIPRKELYEDVNITNEGVDILELEKKAKQYGIILDSYWLEYEELGALEHKGYFVTVINLSGQTHYVIAKKHKKRWAIYDSVRGELKVSCEEFKQVFLNVYIEVKYDKTAEKPTISKTKTTKDACLLINYQKVLNSFLLKLISFSFLIINFYLNKVWIFDTLQHKDFSNVGHLCFFGVLFYVNWVIADYAEAALNIKTKKKYLKDLYQGLFKNIENKKNYFYQKFGKHNFMYLHQHILNIATFRSEQITCVLFNSFLIVFLIGYLCLINPSLIFLVLASFATQSFLSMCLSKLRKKCFPHLIQSANNQKKLFFYLDRFLKKEWNSSKLKEINVNLKNEINQEINLEESMNHKNMIFEKINAFVFNLTTLGCYVLGAWLSNSSTENIILSTILLFYINKSFNKVTDTYFFFDYYQKSLDVYKNWYSIENIDISENEEKINWAIPKVIEIKNLNYYNGKNWVFKNLNLRILKNTFIFGQSGVGKSTIYKFICNKLFSKQKSIFFDGVQQGELKQKDFNDQVIYQINEGYTKHLNWNEIFETLDNSDEVELIKQTLQNLSIDITNHIDVNKLSSGQKQVVNILSLLKHSNKIILLDESISQINKKNKEFILKNIFPILNKRNFLICSEHDLSLLPYFDHYINLSDHVGSGSTVNEVESELSLEENMNQEENPEGLTDNDEFNVDLTNTY